MYRFYSNGVEYELDIEMWSDNESEMLEIDPQNTEISITRKEEDGTITDIQVEYLK